jgi:hypothetical protein
MRPVLSAWVRMIAIAWAASGPNRSKPTVSSVDRGGYELCGSVGPLLPDVGRHEIIALCAGCRKPCP